MSGPHPSVAATRTAVRTMLEGLELGTRVWVACSGGPDSLALVAATGFVAHKEGFFAGAIVVDHGLQEDSAEIAKHAAEQARRAGIANVHIERVSAGTIGGPALLIDYNYGEGDTGAFLPTVTDINLRDWTVASCAPGWQIAGYSNDPIGTVNLTNVAISAMTGTSTATDVTSFTLDNVTVAGKPVTS